MADNLIRWSYCSPVRVRAKQPEPRPKPPVPKPKPAPVPNTPGAFLQQLSAGQQNLRAEAMLRGMQGQQSFIGQQHFVSSGQLSGLGMRGIFG